MSKRGKSWVEDWLGIGGHSKPVYEFMLKHGTEFSGRDLPTRYRMRAPCMCFANSWRLARNSSSLTYVEGYAYSGLIPVHHAWCIDRENKVVDTTWRCNDSLPNHDWEYFGVPFSVSMLDQWMKSKPLWGVLYDLRYGEADYGIGLSLDEIIGAVSS